MANCSVSCLIHTHAYRAFKVTRCPGMATCSVSYLIHTHAYRAFKGTRCTGMANCSVSCFRWRLQTPLALSRAEDALPSCKYPLSCVRVRAWGHRRVGVCACSMHVCMRSCWEYSILTLFIKICNNDYVFSYLRGMYLLTQVLARMYSKLRQTPQYSTNFSSSS